MRRRKAPRVVWLPGTNINSLGAFNRSTVQRVIINTAGAIGESTTGEIPLVIDADNDPLESATQSLSDVENSGYRLRRIVGKIWVAMGQVNINEPPKRLIVCAGLIIRRVSENGQSLASQFADDALTSTLDIEQQGDPWIWRRAWILTNNLAPSSPFGGDQASNNWTFYAGGNSDGPHVDQKTARLVSNEERLFLDVTCMVLEQGSDVEQAIATVEVLADLRVLASMRVSQGNRRNASR